MEHFSWNFVREPKYRPDCICFLEKPTKNEELFVQMLKLPVMTQEINNNDESLKPRPHTIYVLKEFENNPLLKLIEAAENTWILGPTALTEMSLNRTLKFRTKPTYCTFFRGMTFFVSCPGKASHGRRVVELIKWMGGMFVREICCRATHLVATSTLTYEYEYCYTFNVPVLSLGWVEECWANRHTVSFSAASIMKDFKLPPFSGLFIAVNGFSKTEYEDIEYHTKSNGGEVVPMEDPRCTHLIFKDDTTIYTNVVDIPPHISFIVSYEWFRASLNESMRKYEEYFKQFKIEQIKKSRWSRSAFPQDSDSSEDTEETDSNEPILNNNDRFSIKEQARKCAVQDEKRKFHFSVLCDIEKKFINNLKTIVEVQGEAIYHHEVGGPILNQYESKMIFSNISRILDIHENLYNELEFFQERWQNTAPIGETILNVKEKLEKEYKTYISSIDNSLDSAKSSEKNNKRFRNLLDKYKQPKKESPIDLLSRPIQHLCRLSLALSEILKNTRIENPDKNKLILGFDFTKNLLQDLNNNRTKTTDAKKMFEVCSQIDNCPAELIAHTRKLIMAFSAKEISPKGNRSEEIFTLFLFNDVLEVTQIKKKTKVRVGNEGKIYKHIAKLPLSMITHLLYFPQEDERAEYVLGLSVKNEDSKQESIYHFLIIDSQLEVEDLIVRIAKQMAEVNGSSTPKDYVVQSDGLSHFLSQPSDKVPSKMVKSAVKLVKGMVSWRGKGSARKSASCSDLRNLEIAL